MFEIIEENFDEILPQVKNAISRSSFLAVDTEFSSLESLTSTNSRKTSSKTIDQFYRENFDLIKQLTIFQFGLVCFSFDPNENRFDVRAFNFFLKPTSIDPVDVKFVVQSSAIKFLRDFQFDFNQCFYRGISFLNKNQEEILRKSIEQSSTKFSPEERRIFNLLLNEIQRWSMKSQQNSTFSFDLTEKNYRIDENLLGLELIKFFPTNSIKIETKNQRKILTIERSNQKISEQDKEKFFDSIRGFRRIIDFIRQNYRNPIVGKKRKTFSVVSLRFEDFLSGALFSSSNEFESISFCRRRSVGRDNPFMDCITV